MRALIDRCESKVVRGGLRATRCMLKQDHMGLHRWWNRSREETWDDGSWKMMEPS